MGIFDKLLKAIGFEDENEISEERPAEKRQKEKLEINSKFNLKNAETEEKKERIENFTPQSQSDIEKIALEIKNGVKAVVDFSGFAESDRVRALDFLSGVVFILGGNIKKIDKIIYLLEIGKESDEK